MKGMTLYRLSGEKQGALSCATPACFAIWQPLWIAPGTTPTGAKNLGTLKRPDGRIQVTYKGGPLYTYVNDKKAGQVNGNGLKAGVATLAGRRDERDRQPRPGADARAGARLRQRPLRLARRAGRRLELGQRAPDPARRLGDPLLVLDEREADVALAAGAEARARADRDARLPREPHRERL